MQPRISIIVPVYKAERYIRRCLDSIQAQTMTDWECILVDDGSPDRSGDICDEYAGKDSRFIVFHKVNGGVASARQMGIDHARGEYSIHADPDDWVEPNMLKELYIKAKETNAEMVIADYFYETPNGQLYIRQKPADSNHEIMKQLITGNLYGSTWNKLVRSELYKTYDISFPVNMNCMEDTFVICSLLMHDIKVEYIPQAYYHYDTIENQNSITSHGKSQVTKVNLDCLIFFTDYFESVLPKETFQEIFNERKIFIKSLMWYCGYYNRAYFINKYKEINKIVLEEYKQGKHQGSKQFVYALNGLYYPMKLLRLLRS